MRIHVALVSMLVASRARRRLGGRNRTRLYQRPAGADGAHEVAARRRGARARGEARLRRREQQPLRPRTRSTRTTPPRSSHAPGGSPAIRWSTTTSRSSASCAASGVLAVGSSVDLFKSASAAAAFNAKQLQDGKRYDGKYVDAGFRLTDWRATPVQGLGKGAVLVRDTLALGHKGFYGTLVAFRSGPLLGSVSITRADREVGHAPRRRARPAAREADEAGRPRLARVPAALHAADRAQGAAAGRRARSVADGVRTGRPARRRTARQRRLRRQPHRARQVRARGRLHRCSVRRRRPLLGRVRGEPAAVERRRRAA